MKFNTKCVHGSGKPDSTGAISPAIYMSSTFSHPKLGDTTGYQYSRESNPTRDRLEQLIAGLEEGTDALAFSSGMAAVDAVFHLFSLGIISSWVMTCTVALSACSRIFTSKMVSSLRM